MTKITREKILEKLQRLDEYMGYLLRLRKEIKTKKEFLSDFHFFGLVERYLQLCSQTLIDTLDLIIIEENLEKPEDHREAISLLLEKGIISEKLAKKMEGISGFRNILVHEYGKIDRSKVYLYFTAQLEDFEIFKKEILRWLQKK